MPDPTNRDSGIIIDPKKDDDPNLPDPFPTSESEENEDPE